MRGGRVQRALRHRRFNRSACTGKEYLHPRAAPNPRKQKEIDKQKLLAQNVHKRLFKQIFIEETQGQNHECDSFGAAAGANRWFK
jgi:hypothetical protein